MSSNEMLLNHDVYKNQTYPDAPWVVLLHGIGGNSNIWKKQLCDFKEKFNVITIDLPGHYPNPVFNEWDQGYSWTRCCEMIIRVLDNYHLKKVNFAGISLGSIIIHQLIKQYPDRVNSAVLGATITEFNTLSKVLLSIGSALKRFVPYIWLYIIFSHVIMPKRRHSFSRSIFIREARKMKEDQFLKWFELIRSVKQTSVDINTSEVPRLYISGSEDYLFVKLLNQHMESDPYGSLLEIKKCGHLCNIEKSSKFNESAIAFISEQSDVASRYEKKIV
ncbi:alpha/beta fold hydrolase [Desertibacillus haloalkaliphilus]|uniref:alpha/beta fold hydrolase n=1 Tax=Desertibacillus haloalkaliphilus TaxID=1328930 RepID=UPI001C258050|nr:alpha/beta hydrolase [Desertibacillus haloalkaliphilus]MBU8906196.1 alpha/beta hydrolase [Desertibacillus haloalkaliphilus]